MSDLQPLARNCVHAAACLAEQLVLRVASSEHRQIVQFADQLVAQGGRLELSINLTNGRIELVARDDYENRRLIAAIGEV